jgi:uncharacterized protein
MLIEFAITNFLSIKERQVLNLRADNRIDKTEHSEHLSSIKNGHLLKTGIIYGANAAGKSNFLLALNAFKSMVTDSHTYKLDNAIPTYRPFIFIQRTRKHNENRFYMPAF